MNQPMGSDEFYKQYTDINEHKPVLGLVPDRSPTIDTGDWEEERWKSTLEMTTKLIELKIPYYPTISRAAKAASKLIGYYQRKERYS
jgi:hypothetical protein